MLITSPSATVALTVLALHRGAEGLPRRPQDAGLIQGSTLAGPEISFAAMTERQRRVVDVHARRTRRSRPSVRPSASASGWTPRCNRGQLAVGLKPVPERGGSLVEDIINRLRPALTRHHRHPDLPVVGPGPARRRRRRQRRNTSSSLLSDDLDQLRGSGPSTLQDHLQRPCPASPTSPATRTAPVRKPTW